MKTVVIIENETVELQAMVSLFEQWQKEINVLTAKEEKAAITIMSQHHVDLVVCDLALPKIDTLEGFSLLTHTFPYVPCIALSADRGTSPEEAMKRGASHCLEKPIVAAELLQYAADLLDTDTSGTVKGIPIHSFLQMLESEEKTCTLQVNHKKDTGLLYIQNGLLIGAETKNFIGEEAAYLILSWQETRRANSLFQRATEKTDQQASSLHYHGGLPPAQRKGAAEYHSDQGSSIAFEAPLDPWQTDPS